MSVNKQWEITYPIFEFNQSFKDNSTPWAGHKCFGYNLVKNLEPSLVVELGTWKGSSFYSFCQAVKDKKGKSKLIAIDTWQGDLHADKYSENVFNAFKATLTQYYKDVPATYIRKTFSEAVADFDDNSIDVLHIDGFHTYEAVSTDFNTWKGKMKKNGIILFHDICVHKEDFGVFKFWAEIKQQYKYSLEFSHSNGLGVLFLGEEEYNIVAPTFEEDKLKCIQFSYEATKDELGEAQWPLRELVDIKASKYWKLKERVKKILGKR